MAGLCEGGNEPPGSLKAKDRDITYALFCSVLCIMEQVLFDEILKLSVEENPHVYDKQRASYKDEKMKENAWLSIAASLNIDPLKILTRIRLVSLVNGKYSVMEIGKSCDGSSSALRDFQVYVTLRPE
ncbi:hypothetical protein ANN_12358 [Periplaneta americana]|uniref:MADF domain-containing protein n=1 Tax=Periplaneta americana TaxID=6978 RepID=A0ABQ8TGH1_PERAM|nr:hypothetical protein ANN_12358 [Periplaneta americana]